MKKIFCFLTLLLFSSIGMATSNTNPFEELKKLEGKWIGTINKTDGSSGSFNLNYSITSNGSALVEESNDSGIEMLTIFNFQNDQLVLTHYCGLMNKPVSILKSATNGTFYFETDQVRSGLDSSKEAFVGSWKIKVSEDGQSMMYEFTVIGPEGELMTATAEMTKVG
jgi:hypothetical protein